MGEIEFRLPPERYRRLLNVTVGPGVATVGMGVGVGLLLGNGIWPSWEFIVILAVSGLETFALLAMAWYSAVCFTIVDEAGIRFGPRWPWKRRAWTWDDVSRITGPARVGRMRLMHLELCDGQTIALPAPRRWDRLAGRDPRFFEAEELLGFQREHAVRPPTGVRRPLSPGTGRGARVRRR